MLKKVLLNIELVVFGILLVGGFFYLKEWQKQNVKEEQLYTSKVVKVNKGYFISKGDIVVASSNGVLVDETYFRYYKTFF